MLFTEPTFLFYFLPLALLLHRAALVRRGDSYPHGARLLVFVLTLVFYGYREPWWIAPFLACLILDYAWAWAIASAKAAWPRRALLCLSVAQNLALLAIFKYWTFLLELARSVSPEIAASLPRLTQDGVPLSLPPGISFYTFESLSFVIDVYRGHVRPPGNPLQYAAFLGMFPRFVAGPIVRYREVEGQFASYGGMRVEAGLFLFCVGFFCKLGIADSFAHFTRYAFDPLQPPSTPGAWVGSIAFCLQLYFDFNGYSLMAIGLGRCLGFEFPQNFDRPYQATSLKEFWRRWHVTLGLWVRDYLYLPLLGDREKAGPARRYGVLFVTMVIVGVWHGAGWQFVAMGAWFGAWQCAEKRIGWASRAPRPVARALTLFCVLVGWIFLRSPDVGWATRVIAALFGLSDVEFNPTALVANPVATVLASIGFGYCAAGEPRLDAIGSWRLADFARAAVGVALFLVALTFSASASLIPFLYFQF